MLRFSRQSFNVAREWNSVIRINNKILCIIVVIVLVTNCRLAAQQYRLLGNSFSSGSGKSALGPYASDITLGQTATGTTSSTEYQNEFGFWSQYNALSNPSSVQFSVSDGWNLVSAPTRQGDMRLITLFPGAASQAFSYENGYSPKESLSVGLGYWLKFASPRVVQMQGVPLVIETVGVADKWNIIGTISTPVDVSGIAEIGTTVSSQYFGYENESGYAAATTLEPGKGYWVKVNGAGELVLSSASALKAFSGVAPSKQHGIKSRGTLFANKTVNTLTVKDAGGRVRNLFFSTSELEIDKDFYELPPLPPGNIFDVRFSTQRLIAFFDSTEKLKQRISITITGAEYPLRLTWKHSPHTFLSIGNKIISMEEKSEHTIIEPDEIIKIGFSSEAEQELQKEFALFQNFPNPFNPLTSINYSIPVFSGRDFATGGQLPADIWVTLKVYNTLGEEVVTLVNEMQPPGFKSVTWDAGGVPSGVYYYRLQSGIFSDVKKLLFIK